MSKDDFRGRKAIEKKCTRVEAKHDMSLRLMCTLINFGLCCFIVLKEPL